MPRPDTSPGAIPPRSGALFSARGLTAGYGELSVLRGVDLALEPGTLTALIGPNGAGKTTLLHALCGILPAAAGEVTLDGQPLAGRSRRWIARRIALVAQFTEPVPGITVEETVALGRYPWMGPLAPPSAADRAAIESALALMELQDLRGRRLETLSGGERQRVFLARALAQTTPVMLLDEPVANLDLRYQQETFARLRELAASRSIAILVAEHQLNLVSAACDRVIVLARGEIVARGEPEEIVTEEMIRTVFGARMRVVRDERGRPQCLWEF